MWVTLEIKKPEIRGQKPDYRWQTTAGAASIVSGPLSVAIKQVIEHEVGGWKLEVRTQRSEVRGRRSEVGSQKSEVGGQK